LEWCDSEGLAVVGGYGVEDLRALPLLTGSVSEEPQPTVTSKVWAFRNLPSPASAAFRRSTFVILRRSRRISMP